MDSLTLPNATWEWLLAFSFLFNLLHVAIGIWDRVRLKPSVIERLTLYVDWVKFREYKKETDSRIERIESDTEKALETRVTRREFDDHARVVDNRITGLHSSAKEDRRTWNQLYRDLSGELRELVGRLGKGTL